MSNVLFKLGNLNAYEHVPNVSAPAGTSHYTALADGKSKLPVLVMLPGRGEIGMDPTKLLINGPSRFIQNGWDPQDLIIVSVQPLVEWPNPAYVDAILNNVITRYAAISDGRINMTGLSAGSYAIDNYIGQSAANSAKVNSVVSMSAPTPETYFNPSFFTQPAWGFCGTMDSWYQKMKARFTALGKKWTSYPDGHGDWNQFYNPEWKENGVSIYDFVKSANGSVVPPIIPPVATPPYPVAVLMSDGTQKAVAK